LPNTTPLYNLFVEKYIDQCLNFLVITPSRWFSGGKGLDKFRKFMLSRKDIKLIKHFSNSKDCFPNVLIEGGVSYFLKVNTACKCQFNDTEIELNRYDILLLPKYIKIIDQLENYPNITKIYLNRNFYKIETNDKRLHDTFQTGDITCYVSEKKKKDRKRYINNSVYTEPEIKNWKVITAEANGNKPNFGFMTVIRPEDAYTNSYVGFKVEDEKQGHSLVSYLKCKLPNILLATRKISQHISTDTVKWIPIVPLDRTWTDEKVLQYFKLTEKDLE
jgi:site-specific DNA-methyltransferase (adenine-specific)